MALQPVNRRSVPEDVFEQIVAEVLSGDMQPGEALPSERRLAEVLGVSRPAVREAIKRLTAAGLVESTSGRCHHRPRLPPPRRPRPAPPAAHPCGRGRSVRGPQHPRNPTAQRPEGRRARRAAATARSWPACSTRRCGARRTRTIRSNGSATPLRSGITSSTGPIRSHSG